MMGVVVDNKLFVRFVRVEVQQVQVSQGDGPKKTERSQLSAFTYYILVVRAIRRSRKDHVCYANRETRPIVSASRPEWMELATR